MCERAGPGSGCIPNLPAEARRSRQVRPNSLGANAMPRIRANGDLTETEQAMMRSLVIDYRRRVSAEQRFEDTVAHVKPRRDRSSLSAGTVAVRKSYRPRGKSAGDGAPRDGAK